MHGLNSPQEAYFFTKHPEDYKLSEGSYSYEISQATEHSLANTKAEVRRKSRFSTIELQAPSVDVQGKKYSYVIRSSASREDFARSMSPESLYAKRDTGITGIRGLHYSASDVYGDAIGVTIEAETPEEAKEQFQSWYAQIKDALNALENRFAILNKELDEKIEIMSTKRLDEINRAKKAL